MRTVLKYPIHPDGTTKVSMPESAVILDVQWQHGRPTIWALTDIGLSPETGTELELELRTFRVIATGERIPERNIQFLATIQVGPYVWHIFEIDP